MYKFNFDQDGGILEVRARGVWTPETVMRYRSDLAVEAVAARAQAGRLKLLFNAVEFSVQPQDAADKIQLVERVAIEPGDRVAVLLASSLLKLQARRVFEGWSNLDLFVSENAARTWLQAGDAVAAGRGLETVRAGG